MRIRGEIAHGTEEEEEIELEEEKMVAQKRYTAAAVGGGFSPTPAAMKAVVVGYALTSKKVKSFLQPKLERLARSKGIVFVAIDHNKPLSDQGPFDVVLHKLSGKEWRHVLEDTGKCQDMNIYLRISFWGWFEANRARKESYE
ncbi:hypothetical protein ACS0TY_025514 [Phlomoides rotata]